MSTEKKPPATSCRQEKVDYDTFLHLCQRQPDEGSLTLDASLFRRGTNLIAVEVHNNSSNSSDIYWDASLILTSSNNNGQIVCTEETYTLPDNGTVNLVACYEALSNDECTEAGIVPVRINEISADNSIYINDYFQENDWIELYNTTDEAIDVAGMYVSDNLLVPPNTKSALRVLMPQPLSLHTDIWSFGATNCLPSISSMPRSNWQRRRGRITHICRPKLA